jgi:cytochrome P450
LSALFGIALNGSPWQYMLSMRADGYGGATRVPLGPFGGDFVFLLEPSVLKQALLEDAEEYFPRRYSVPLFPLLDLDRGIVYEQGARHKRQKKLCIPAFEQSRSMSSFLSAVLDETDVLSGEWRARSKGGEAIRLDLYKEARRLTLSVILRVTFGLGEAGREFKDAGALSATIGQYLESIVATANEVPPLWSIAPALSANYRKVTSELLPRLRTLVSQVIAERRQRDKQAAAVTANTAAGAAGVGESEGDDGLDRADLLSVLIRDDSLSDEDVSYILFDLIIAGSDTTASTISAALFLLHEPRHSEALRAARAEVANVDMLALSLETVKERLPYASAIAKEVLRLYPPVPFVGRTAVAERDLAGGEGVPGGVRVPVDGTLCFSPYALGRDPASWGADADTFRPQRWLDNPANGGAPSSFCWLPFGAGPRGCLGTRLGLTEVVVGVGLMLQRFEFAFDKADEGLQYKYDLTLNLEGTTLCEARPT